MDPKHLAIAILTKKAEHDDEDSGESAAAVEATAGNILAAMKSGDSSELAASLREFISLCKEQ